MQVRVRGGAPIILLRPRTATGRLFDTAKFECLLLKAPNPGSSFDLEIIYAFGNSNNASGNISSLPDVLHTEVRVLSSPAADCITYLEKQLIHR